MSLKKEIENRKKIEEVKNIFKDVVGSLTKTVQDTVGSFSSTIEGFNARQLKKEIYAKAIDYVEKLLIESNIKSPTPIKISMDKLEGFTSIPEIIMTIADDYASQEIFENGDYINTIFDVLINYFDSEEELEIEYTTDTIVIKFKEEIIKETKEDCDKKEQMTEEDDV